MKHPQPWFWAVRKGWCVCRNGKQVRLGDHPPKAPKPITKNTSWNPPTEILDAYHKLMGEDEQPLPKAVHMKHVIDGWLADHKTIASYRWFEAFLEDFKETYGKLRVKLKRALRADIDESAWSSLYSTAGRSTNRSRAKIAVKVINHYGDEVLKVFAV